MSRAGRSDPSSVRLLRSRPSPAPFRQDDLLNAHLTVEETLRYTAELRMPRTCTPEERTERVTEVLQQVSAGGG